MRDYRAAHTASFNRRQKISVKAAADLDNISEDTFRRHYADKIKQVAPRRQAVELGDALDIGEPIKPAA